MFSEARICRKRFPNLFAVTGTACYAVVDPGGHKFSGADYCCELPRKGGKPLFLFDRFQEQRNRVVELHQEGHFVRAAGGERSSDETGLNDRDVDTAVFQVQADAFEKSGHSGFACGISGGFRKAAETGEAGDSDEMAGTSLRHLRRDRVDRVDGTDKIGIYYFADRTRGVGPGLLVISADPRVRDQNIDPPELGPHFLRRLVLRLFVRYVERKDPDLNIKSPAAVGKVVKKFPAARGQS